MNFKNLRQLTEQYELILGSGSPRRVRLLSEIGIEFRQIIPDLEEQIEPGESPIAYAERLAADKALLVARQADDRQFVLGCDTIVVLGDEILEKPRDKEDAFAILSQLAGNRHTVYTALAMIGLFFTCAYILKGIKQVLHGPMNEDWVGHITEINAREVFVIVPLMVMILWIGVWPAWILDVINNTVKALF